MKNRKDNWFKFELVCNGYRFYIHIHPVTFTVLFGLAIAFVWWICS